MVFVFFSFVFFFFCLFLPLFPLSMACCTLLFVVRWYIKLAFFHWDCLFIVNIFPCQSSTLPFIHRRDPKRAGADQSITVFPSLFFFCSLSSPFFSSYFLFLFPWPGPLSLSQNYRAIRVYKMKLGINPLSPRQRPDHRSIKGQQEFLARVPPSDSVVNSHLYPLAAWSQTWKSWSQCCWALQSSMRCAWTVDREREFPTWWYIPSGWSTPAGSPFPRFYQRLRSIHSSPVDIFMSKNSPIASVASVIGSSASCIQWPLPPLRTSPHLILSARSPVHALRHKKRRMQPEPWVATIARSCLLFFFFIP